MTRGGLWLAIALLTALPLDARSDDQSGETLVIQDASGRVLVVPATSGASAPKPVLPAKPAPAVARVPAAPAREGVRACEDHDDLVRQWLDARTRVIEAQARLEAAESIPLTGMGGYRDARIAGAELRLERAETREMEIESNARNLGVPQSCFDDSHLPQTND